MYEMPREKLARKGAESLSNAELLQVIIGSGSARMPVAKIAKKVAKVLSVSGSAVHPQELLTIQGVGRVKAGQILALFELAARFPSASSGEVFNTNESFKSIYKGLDAISKQTFLYATFDGANRLIAKRQFVINKSTSVAKETRRIFADCITDSAASLMVAIGFDLQPLEAELTELSFMRDVYKTSQLLTIPVKKFILISKDGEVVLKEFAS